MLQPTPFDVVLRQVTSLLQKVPERYHLFRWNYEISFHISSKKQVFFNLPFATYWHFQEQDLFFAMYKETLQCHSIAENTYGLISMMNWPKYGKRIVKDTMKIPKKSLKHVKNTAENPQQYDKISIISEPIEKPTTYSKD